MNLKYFDETYCDELIDNIENNYKYYLSNENWVDKVFKNDNYYLESNIEFSKPELDDNDFTNALKIYESLSSISLTQASSPLLWTYLTHCTFYDYMKKRWMIEGENLTKEMSTKIKERYFCKNTRRGLLRNGISRLWWAVYLSMDDSSSDKYKYTKILMSDEDLFVGLMERDYSMCKNIVLGVLKAFYDYKEKNTKIPSRDCRRSLYIYINQYGAASLLDSLSIDYVERMALEFIINYIKQNENH